MIQWQHKTKFWVEKSIGFVNGKMRFILSKRLWESLWHLEDTKRGHSRLIGTDERFGKKDEAMLEAELTVTAEEKRKEKGVWYE